MKASPHCNVPIQVQMFKIAHLVPNKNPSQQQATAWHSAGLFWFYFALRWLQSTHDQMPKHHFCVCTLRFYFQEPLDSEWLCKSAASAIIALSFWKSLAGPQRMWRKSMGFDWHHAACCFSDLRKSTKLIWICRKAFRTAACTLTGDVQLSECTRSIVASRSACSIFVNTAGSECITMMFHSDSGLSFQVHIGGVPG